MAAAAAAPPPLIKVAALCGSLRKGSYNRGLLRAAIDVSKSINGLEIEYVDISPLPFLNTDLEVNGTFPPAVEAFRQKIAAADSILFASPEYNYSVTGPLKNAIDWASRPSNVWADKAAAIVSAGGGFGGGRSHYHLRQTGVFIDLHFINNPEFFLKVFEPPAKFDSEGNLIDESAKENLKEVLLSLFAFTLRLQASPGNNDQMNAEDSMAEDPAPSSAPGPVFGQPSIAPSPPGFGFGSSVPSKVNPFIFGGQQHQVAPQNPSPFQASGSLEFNAGGSFSLGSSGAGHKSGRKIAKIKRSKNRK